MGTSKNKTASKTTTKPITSKTTPQLSVYERQLIELKNIVALLEQIKGNSATLSASEANSIPTSIKSKNEAPKAIKKALNKTDENESILLDLDSKLDCLITLVKKQGEALSSLEQYLTCELEEKINYLIDN